MAVGGVSESLIIDVSVQDDGASKNLHKVGTEAKRAGDETSKAFDRASTSARETNRILDLASAKFRALGKAAIGIFAADVAAKLLGFRSALDAIQKLSDKAAEGLRALFSTAASRSAEQASENIANLREEISKLQDQLYQRAPLSVRGQNIGVRLPAGLSPSNQLRALYLVEQAQKRIQELEATTPDPNARPMSLFGGTGALTPEGARRLNQVRREADPLMRVVRDLSNELDALMDAQDAAAGAAKRHAKMLHDLARAAKPQEGMPFMLSGIPAFLSQYPAMREAFQRRDFVAKERWNRVADDSMQRFGLGMAGFTAGLLDQRQRSSEAASRGAFATDERWNQLSTQSLQRFSVGLASLSTELTKAALAKQKFDASFGGGASEALATLAKDFERNLGSQAVQQTFDSFTGFFMDLFTNVRNADEALKNLGRSLLAVLANQAAQRLAMGATNALFGAFGLTSQASGGVWRGGINSFASGGVAYGPQLAMIGDNRSRTEAIVPMPDGRSIPVEMRGGGGTVNMTLNFASIDPRTSADLVLANMPAIQRGIASALAGGSDRGLTLAIRGAVA